MRKARLLRAKRVRRAKAMRRRGLRLEPLESRIVLTATPQLIDIHPGASSDPNEFVQIGNVTYFVATDADHGRELWKTDGTAAGTELVKDIRDGESSSNPTRLTNVNGVLFFAADDGESGEELWMSNGTGAGTVIVRDIHISQSDPANTSSSPRELILFNGMLYFTAVNENGRELWMSDGTEQGTMPVKDLFPGSSGATPNSSNPAGLTVVGSNLLFTATDVNGTELWISDGMADGTVLLKDIFAGSSGATANSSNPGQLTNVNGTLFFTANNGATGTELWKSDGTTNGTVLVKDIFTGTSYQQGVGTVPNSSQPMALTAVGNTLFFAANDGSHGEELWKSDGTEAGTVLVKDIRPGSEGQLSYEGSFAAVNGILFFSADDGASGRELWKSDGTEAGTVLVKDLHPGTAPYTGNPLSSFPYHLTNINGVLYFSAFSPDSGRELWQSDGTAAGTVLVTDVGGSGDGLYPTGVVNANGSLLVSTDDGFRRELFTLDGEVQTGTVRLTIFVDGQQVAIPANVGVYSGGGTAALHSTNATGNLVLGAASGITLGSFFQTWRTNAGLAGNNASAAFSAAQLMGSTATFEKTVQMFVNGQITRDFENYVVQEGDQIVLVYSENPVVSLNTNFGSLVFELFASATPITVANFLDYINDGDYLNSIFHRSAKLQNGEDFVIQGGGFTTPSTTFTNINQFTNVPTEGTIQNEPGIPNLRGTIAMAKMAGDPNSATSQFFFNLNDDNTFLDLPQNNSFTVFGQVLDMTVADTIAALPRASGLPVPFNDLPLGDEDELVVVQSITGQGDLTGVKFIDVNGNGVQDAGEAGMAGIVIYADANSNAVLDEGEASTLTDSQGRYRLQVTPGQYTVRSEVIAGLTPTVGAAGYAVTVEIGSETNNLNFGEAPPQPPTAVDLLPGSDTGALDDDNLTNLNNSTSQRVLQFLVSGVVDGATVQLFSGSTQIGSAVASGDSVVVTTNGAASLTDGVNNITARQIVNGGISQQSPALAITIDTVAPPAVSNTAPGLAPHDQLYTFDADSPDEGQAGVSYALENPLAGMTIDAQTGVVSWTPMLAQAGPQALTVLVSDTAGNTAARSFEVTVLGVIAGIPDTYTVDAGATLAVGAAAGVLANDSDGDPNGLTAEVVTQPANGTLTFNPDGSFIYVPNAGFAGIDSFLYKSGDGTDESNVARATINVISQNESPVAASDAYSVSQDNVLSVSAAQGVLKNDSEPEGDPLTVTLLSGPANGTVTLNANGSFTYAPNAGFTGSDSFTYAASDGTSSSNTATVQITVSSTVQTPTVFTGSISGSVYLDANGDGARSAGESGVPGALLTLTGTTLSGGQITRTQVSAADGSFTFQTLPAGTYSIVESQPQALVDGLDSSSVPGASVGNDVISNLVLGEGQNLGGNLFGEAGMRPQYVSAVWLFASSAANMEGTFREMIAMGEQNAGHHELAAAIRSGANDTSGQTNESPVAANDAYAVAGGGALNVPVAIGVLSNDFDANGDPLAALLVTTTTNGALALNADGSFTYTPNSGFSGIDFFTYRASDGQLSSNTVTVNISVGSASNQAPLAASNVYTTSGGVLTVNAANGLLANDTDVNGHRLTALLVGAPQNGALSLSASGAFVYTPNPGFSGADTFTYLASDGHLTSNTATVTINVTATDNRTPVAAADAYSTTGGTISVDAAAGVLANDTDADGDPLTAELFVAPQNGAFSLNADGSFTYTPSAGFSGSDSFTYLANDGKATSAVATVTINVSGSGNTAPVAIDDTYATSSEMLHVDAASGVLANDTDAQGNGLTAELLTAPQHGTLSFHADGSFSYTPADGFNGSDTFTYRASDGSLDSNTATVTIDATPPNQAPVAVPDSYSTGADATLMVGEAEGVLDNDTDFEGDTLSAIVVTQPQHGTLTLNSDGSFEYEPDPGYTGSDSFTYRASDGEDDSEETTVMLEILPAEGEPAEGEPFPDLVDAVFGDEEDWL